MPDKEVFHIFKALSSFYVTRICDMLSDACWKTLGRKLVN